MIEPIDPDRPLGALVRENPAFAHVFEAVGLDFCCGGDQMLRTACTEADLDLDAVREQLDEARRKREERGDEWESMTALIEHVVDSHHQYLREELPAWNNSLRKFGASTRKSIQSWRTSSGKSSNWPRR